MHAIRTVLWVLSHLAQWHTMSWPSGHLGPPGISGNVQGNSDTSGMTLWHTGTLLACWHTCWYSWQTHGTGRLMMVHTDPSIWKTSDSQADVVRQFHSLYGFKCWVVRSEVEQALRNQSNPRNQKNMVKNW